MRFTSEEAVWPSKPTMNRSPTRRTLSRMGPPSAAEPLAHGVADLLAVGGLASRLQRGQRGLDGLAHVLRRRGPRLRDGRLGRGVDVRLRRFRGQVLLQDLDLRLLLAHQLRAAGLAEVEDGVLALLDQALQDLHGLRVVERRLLLDLPVHEGGLGHPQRRGARRVPGLHGRGQVYADALGQRLRLVHARPQDIAHPPRRVSALSFGPMSRPAPPRRTAVVLAFLAAALPALAAPSLVRLAEAFAGEIVRAARGRPVEVAVPEDRTGRGASLALDLRALVLDRLRGRATVADSGPRLRVQSVLSETATGLVVSARVVEEPGERLVDLLSASVAAALSLLALSPVRPPPAPATVDVVSMARTPPLDSPVLD